MAGSTAGRLLLAIVAVVALGGCAYGYNYPGRADGVGSTAGVSSGFGDGPGTSGGGGGRGGGAR